MSCEETAGFLFRHPCSREAVSACAECGRGLCALHMKPWEGSSLCVACALRYRQEQEAGQRPPPGEGKPGEGGEGGEGDEGDWDTWDDDPYFYGSTHYRGWGRGWGHERGDRHELSEADGASLRGEGDEGFEQAPGAS